MIRFISPLLRKSTNEIPSTNETSLEVSFLFHLLEVFHLWTKNVSFVVLHLLHSQAYDRGRWPAGRGVMLEWECAWQVFWRRILAGSMARDEN